ncbi:hypothetical protein EBR66_01075 [bacterium]|nr:hypothetical protein [bacterium]
MNPNEWKIVGWIEISMLLGSFVLGGLILAPLFFASTDGADQYANVLIGFSASFFGGVIDIFLTLACAWVGVWSAARRKLFSYETSAERVALFSVLFFWILSDATHLIFIIFAPLATVLLVLVQLAALFVGIKILVQRAIDMSGNLLR